ncbi:MAG: DUF4296 domain-containing protein [Saprospiraceae bacterium]|nr:DUF4296 domain-containing protein [Saprospiraceae bacterium]
MKFALKYIYITLVICFAACSDSDDQINMEHDRMVDLLFDIQVAKIATENAPPNDRDSLAKVYRRQILDMHDMNKEEFDEFVNSLSNSPQLMDSLYIDIESKVDSLKESMKADN